jgi:hypothetical protein
LFKHLKKPKKKPQRKTSETQSFGEDGPACFLTYHISKSHTNGIGGPVTTLINNIILLCGTSFPLTDWDYKIFDTDDGDSAIEMLHVQSFGLI